MRQAKFRKPSEIKLNAQPKSVLSIRIAPKTRKELQALAKASGLNVSRLLEAVIEDYLQLQAKK
ncbi:MAG: ribbon-helix-helix protein, CopG family [Bdellovibrionota bacterium]